MGVDLNLNWRRTHLLVFPIKRRALSQCSTPLLLHKESEITPLFAEIGFNWPVRLLIDLSACRVGKAGAILLLVLNIPPQLKFWKGLNCSSTKLFTAKTSFCLIFSLV